MVKCYHLTALGFSGLILESVSTNMQMTVMLTMMIGGSGGGDDDDRVLFYCSFTVSLAGLLNISDLIILRLLLCANQRRKSVVSSGTLLVTKATSS